MLDKWYKNIALAFSRNIQASTAYNNGVILKVRYGIG